MPTSQSANGSEGWSYDERLSQKVGVERTSRNIHGCSWIELSGCAWSGDGRPGQDCNLQTILRQLPGKQGRRIQGRPGLCREVHQGQRSVRRLFTEVDEGVRTRRAQAQTAGIDQRKAVLRSLQYWSPNPQY